MWQKIVELKICKDPRRKSDLMLDKHLFIAAMYKVIAWNAFDRDVAELNLHKVSKPTSSCYCFPWNYFMCLFLVSLSCLIFTFKMMTGHLKIPSISDQGRGEIRFKVKIHVIKIVKDRKDGLCFVMCLGGFVRASIHIFYLNPILINHISITYKISYKNKNKNE